MVCSSSLKFGVVAKGRLYSQINQFFDKVGLSLKRDSESRSYLAHFKDFPEIEVMFLNASEIAKKLISGEIHFGITGRDLLAEYGGGHYESYVSELVPLDFGKATLVIAVPLLWVDVLNIDDFDDLAAGFAAKYGFPVRVATKYPNLTRSFFKKVGISNYSIVNSQSATEGLPAQGIADVIIDITSTGQTIAENFLRIPSGGKILESEAVLAGSLSALWDQELLKVLKRFLSVMLSVNHSGKGIFSLVVYFESSFDSREGFIQDLAKRFPNVNLSVSSFREVGNCSKVYPTEQLLLRCADKNCLKNVNDYLMMQDDVVVESYSPVKYKDGKHAVYNSFLSDLKDAGFVF